MPTSALRTSQVAPPSRLAAEDVSSGYGGKVIVRDVTLTVPDAALTVLIGPNGCGKSTLLKTMARVLPASAGQVLLDGRPVHDTPTRNVAKRMALLPQGPTAPEGLRVRELVAQGRFPHQSLMRQWSREDARAVEAAMEAADVAQFAGRPVSELSGGQRQRCWVAMVLAQETDIILLDEPTTFLDLKVQVELMKLLRRIAHEDGRTLVVVLHELNVAAAFADLLVMMKDGRLVSQGPVETAFTAEALAEVFGLEASVVADPVSGRPVCVPIVAPSLAVAAQ
ncbi:ABC transporter ATP-binding protein [Pseudoroseicyclus tamaricis]|uniref:ABC transporter ATP-binding protein n=1 Tax=Pseudoroseicyclus tamaricis TaxID=2705421 RepID=A0A6B2JIL2_9RHOB|nr:ABC transporter ATP-binding protein [Pseudoroseicyclus tamaricis]NDV01223.1 ABC transporter ATP-binding protein [Pseudoroseicyclus tamaricis]